MKSTAAWQGYSRLARRGHLGDAKEKAAALPTLNAIANDVNVQDKVRKMNVCLKTMFPFFGRTDAPNDIIKLVSPNEMFIPWNVWCGKFNIPRGTLSPADTQTVDDQEAIFADNAGLLRHHIGKILATQAVLNDLGNVNARPNAGGVGGETAP